MATPDRGVAAVAYAPSVVRTSVAGDTPVVITEETEYPFRGDVRLKVAPERSVGFPLLLRLPDSLASFERALGLDADSLAALKGATEVAYRMHSQKAADYVRRVLVRDP